MSGARLVPPLIVLATSHRVRVSGVILVPCCFVEAGGTRVLFADPMAMRPTVIPAVRVPSDFTGRARSPRSAGCAGASLVGQFFVGRRERRNGASEGQVGSRELFQHSFVVRGGKRQIVQGGLEPIHVRRERSRRDTVCSPQWLTPPRSQYLTLALEMREAERSFPGRPGAGSGWESFPIIHLAGKMLGGEDSGRSHHHQLDVSDGHVCAFGFLLCILQHDDVLGDAVSLRVILVHVGTQRQHIHGVKTSAVQVEEPHDFQGRNLCGEGFRVLEVVVPHLVDHIPEEFSTAAFGGFVVVVVFEFGLVGCLRADADHSRGIVGDALVVEG